MRNFLRHLLSIIIIFTFSLFPPVLTSEIHKENMALITEPEIYYPSVFNINGDGRIWIDSLLNRMTVRERVAQMIMPWAGGNYTTETSKEYLRLKHLIKDLKVGGFIFFKGDILNEAMLINRLQDLSTVPLLISSDFERGLAMRLTDATEFPYNMALAAAGDLSLASEMGRIISLESRAMGIHQNYAPVADINNNADNPIINIRAYSEDRDIVSKYCEAFISGSVKGGMISTVKHFPGHGNTATDSHKELPVINGSREELYENELAPFIHAINSGVHSVMVGHLRVPAFEPSRTPATLSRNIITGLLKEELGFRGLIVTDAMNMNAVTRYYSAAEAAILAIKAGNDILLMPPDEDIAINSISEAVYSGEIPLERINESVRKILSAKKWIGLDRVKTVDLTSLPSLIGNENNTFYAHEIAEKSITLVRNLDNLVPVNPAKIYSTSVISISDGQYSGELFNELTDGEFGYVRTFNIDKGSRENEFRKAITIAKNSDLVIVPSYIKVKAYQGTVSMPEKQRKFLKELLSLNKPTLIISFGNPYLLSLFPEARNYITAYGDASVSQRAMIRAITGKTDISGRLPISIPGTIHKCGEGIIIKHYMLVNEGAKLNLQNTEDLIRQNIVDGTYPAASLLVISEGKTIYSNVFGKNGDDEYSSAISRDFIFDIDHLTALYTTAAALITASEGLLDLNSKVEKYLPGKTDQNLYVRELLYKSQTGLSDLPSTAAALTGSESRYILLQKVTEKAAGKSLDKIMKEKIFQPLNLIRTMFNPPKELWFYSVPTSQYTAGSKKNKGVVYDIAAFNNGGLTGEAGLFTNGEELAVFLQMLIQKGKYGKQQLINEDIFNSWITISGEEIHAIGKTGTAVKVNFVNKQAIIILTNSSYTGNLIEFQNMLPGVYETINNSVSF